MIIREFLAWTQNASASHRAEATAVLTRAYLYGNLAADQAWEAKTALLTLLDDPSPLVRRALAETCAASARTPRPLVVALSCDVPEVARLVLARSPVLTDADLVDAAALGDDVGEHAVDPDGGEQQCERGERREHERREAAVAALLGLEQGLGGRAVEVGGAVEAVDLDEDRAGLRRAAPPLDRRDALDAEAAQVGRDPEIGAQAHACRASWTSARDARKRPPEQPGIGSLA